MRVDVLSWVVVIGWSVRGSGRDGSEPPTLTRPGRRRCPLARCSSPGRASSRAGAPARTGPRPTILAPRRGPDRCMRRSRRQVPDVRRDTAGTDMARTLGVFVAGDTTARHPPRHRVRLAVDLRCRITSQCTPGRGRQDGRARAPHPLRLELILERSLRNRGRGGSGRWGFGGLDEGLQHATERAGVSSLTTVSMKPMPWCDACTRLSISTHGPTG